MKPKLHSNAVKLTLGDNARQAWVQEARRIVSEHQRVPVKFKADLVLGSISNSFIPELAHKPLVSSFRVAYPSSDGSSVCKVRTNSRHLVTTLEHIARMHSTRLKG